MIYEEKERAYHDHEERADNRGLHIDGCFYCGGNHPSDCCAHGERDSYWKADDDRKEGRR